MSRARRALVFALTSAVVLAGTAAFAGNEPLLELTFPADNGTARSVTADPIFARYDRPLNEAHTTFQVRDASNAPVAGTVFLSEPPGNIKGQRQVNFRPAAPLSEAASPYTARVKARARVPGDEATTIWTFWIDDTAPAAPVVTDPLNGQVRTDQPLVVRGSGEPGATALVVENAVVIAQDRIAGTGAMEVFLPYPPEDGVSHTFEVFQRDPAGNTSPAAGPITIWHDSVVRVPIITTPLEGSFLKTSTVTVAGNAKAGTTIRLREGGPVIATTTTNAQEEWSVPVTFADGVHAITAESWDGVMTDGPSPARSFTVDTVAPAAPVITAPAPGATIASETVLIQGTAEPHASVQIRHQGIVRATVPVTGSGAWQAMLDFVEGSHTIEVRAIDRAGNVGPLAARTFTVDTVAPATPIIDSPAHDAFLSSNTVAVTGQTEPGATIEIMVGTVVAHTTVANGAGLFSTSMTFADGAHTIAAFAVDAGGNRSPRSPDRSFTVDTVAPLAPVIEQPAEASTVTTNAVTIGGTGEDAVTIEVWEGATLLGTTTVDGTGTWSLTVTLPNGGHAVRARAVDLASNIGPFSAVRSFTVSAVADVTPPAAPILVQPASGSIQRANVVFTGTAEAGATVTIWEAGVPVASGTAAGGNFAFSGTLSDGPHTVTATATDAAGNQSIHTAARTFSVDAVRPTISISTQDSNVFMPLTTVRVDGTATDDRGVVFVEIEYQDLAGGVVSHVTGCTGCPGSPVAWADEPALAPGSYRVTVRAVDAAGNRSQPGSIRIYVI